MANEGPITKIYRIVVEGFDESKAELQKMSLELARLKKAKQDLDKELAKSTKPEQVAQLNQKIQAQVILEAELTKSIQEKNRQIQLGAKLQGDNGTEGIGAAMVAYQNLINLYKEAVVNSQAMEAQFGKESAEAIEAARAAAIYEAELAKINQLRGAPIPAAESVPFTSNLAALEAEQAALKQTGTAVSEFDLQQAEAANSALAMGQAQITAAEEVEAAQASFVATKGSLDQYTGSLRDNIRVQLENAQAIAANRTAQKAINEEIKASGGSATELQLERLAALKEEAVILDQSQKQLTTTIRNQAREFVAANGSLEEGRAKVNQLQQAYAQLSETERAQPFGQGIKDEIDILEPKVKSLEAEIGLFQRNVGNYPSNFTGAFKVLDNELDTLKGKLVQGNFTGAAFDDLTRKTAVLEQATQKLNTTFTSTTAEQTAYKQAAHQVAAEFGTESVVFQNFSKEVQAGNTKLQETDKALVAVSGSGKKAGNVFQTVFSGLRNIANILPGLGLSGLILLLFTPLEALASKIADVVTNFKLGSQSVDDFKEKLEGANVAVHESQKEFVGAFEAVESLRINVDLASKGFLKKDDVLKQYNETMGKTTGKLTDFNDIEKKLVDAGPAYIQMMLLRAAANIALQKAAEEAFKAEETRRENEQRITRIQADVNKKNQDSEEKGLNQFLERTAKAEEGVDKRRADTAINLQKSIAEKFQKDAADIAKTNSFSFFPDDKKIKEQADKLNVTEQNALKLIDATLKTELAVENTRFNEIEKNHAASYDEEIIHLKRVEEINVNALNSKISLLSKQKKLNAEELSQLADFKEKRSSIELQTSKQIQDIEKKRFADENKDLQASLDANIAQAKEAQQKVLDNPNTSNLERARANLEFIDTEIVAYRQYYNQLLDLNDNYSKEELQKVRDHIASLTKERNRGLNTDLAAQEKDIIAQGDFQVTEINIDYQKRKTAILTNEKITQQERERLIEQLSTANNITILTKELQTINEQLKVKFQMLITNNATEAEYEKLRLAGISKAYDLEKALRLAKQKEIDDAIKAKPKTIQEAATKGADKLANVDENSEEAKAIGEATSQAFSLAGDAMHNYYDAERQRIQDSLALNLQRLDLEEQQVKARATSQAEIDSIDKQYAAKKKDAQRKAGEETKKTKKAELRIALVSEIANDAVAAAAYPFPFSLAIFGVMSALALGRYALGVSQINAQQFAFGGEVSKNNRGGIAKGRSHAQGGNKFMFKGVEYEDEVDELRIIRTKNAPAPNKVFNITGTHKQIASQLNVIGGGVSFAPGAKLKKFDFGGSIGSTLQAPVFIPSSNGSSNNTGNNKELLDEIRNLRADQQKNAADISSWQSTFQVIQTTESVTKAQRKQVQQKAIGTL